MISATRHGLRKLKRMVHNLTTALAQAGGSGCTETTAHDLPFRHTAFPELDDMVKPLLPYRTLTDLPAELIDLVVGNWHARDSNNIRNLRLVDRSVCVKVEREFVARYFQHRAHTYTVDSRETLVAITGHAKLASKLQSLEIVFWEPSEHRYNAASCGTRDARETTTECSKSAKDLQRLRRAATGELLLARVFSNLKALNVRIKASASNNIFDYAYGYWGLKSETHGLIRSFGVCRMGLLKGRIIDHYGRLFLRSLLRAQYHPHMLDLFACRVSPGIGARCFSLQTDKRAGLTRLLGTLTGLALHLSEQKLLSCEASQDRIARVLREMQSLQRLELAFDGGSQTRHCCKITSPLLRGMSSGNFNFGGLRVLHLRAASVEPADLRGLLSTAASSLQDLSLVDVWMPGVQGPHVTRDFMKFGSSDTWVKLLTWTIGEMHLKTLVLEQLSEGVEDGLLTVVDGRNDEYIQDWGFQDTVDWNLQRSIETAELMYHQD